VGPAAADRSAATSFAAGPQIQLVSVTVHDANDVFGEDLNNVNGKADPGETVGLQIAIKDISGVGLSNVTGTLEVSFGGTSVTPLNAGPQQYTEVSDNDTFVNLTDFVARSMRL